MEVRFPISLRAREGTRTPDQLITNQLLYQLSYSGLKLRIHGTDFLDVTLDSKTKNSPIFLGKAKVMENVKSKNFVPLFLELFQQLRQAAFP